MFSNNRAGIKKFSRIFAIVSLVILIICLSACAPKEMPGKEALENGLATIEEGRYSYACSYLVDMGFNNFDNNDFRLVEYKFNQYTIYELESPYVLACETARFFLDNFYSNIDLTDKTAVTDSLIYSYVVATGDRYAAYMSPVSYEDYTTDMSGNFVGIGVEVLLDYENGTVLVQNVMDDSPALEGGLKNGDYIIAVDGVTINVDNVDETVDLIKGESGTTVNVTVKRGEESLTFTLTRRAVVEKTVKYTIDEDKIAYIKITSFKDNTFAMFKEAVDSAERDGALAVIFDLRSNSGGYLHAVVDMLSYLVPKDTRIVSYYDTYSKKEIVYEAEDDHVLRVPCVALCNNYTASAAELFTSALRDYNDWGVLDATVIGANTYGKGVMQDVFSLGGGYMLKLTMAYYNPPCNVNYDGVGVIPDVAVEGNDPTVDTVFNTGKEFLMKKLGKAN